MAAHGSEPLTPDRPHRLAQRHHVESVRVKNCPETLSNNIINLHHTTSTLELIGVILPCHRDGSSRFPQEQPGIERVQHTGARSTFTVLPDVGHVPMIDDPALVARTILMTTGAGMPQP